MYTFDEVMSCVVSIALFSLLILVVLHAWWVQPIKELRLLVGLSVPGYMLARTYIHTLTGVDPNNFNATLLLFTPIIAGSLLALVHGLLGALTALGMLVRGLWQWLERRRTRWPTIESGWVNILLGLTVPLFVFGLWKNDCVHTIENAVTDVAKLVLVRYEFAHDPTCAVSTEVRWVAPLKDRKEMKISNVLAATYLAWNNITFELDQCEKAPQPSPSGAL